MAIGHDPNYSAGFPAARIYLDTFDNPLADTISYERPYGIAIDLWQEITNKSKRNAELDLANALHQVLDRLSGTWQLGIAVENSEIQAGQVRPVETPAGPMLLAPIRLKVTTLIQNPS